MTCFLPKGHDGPCRYEAREETAADHLAHIPCLAKAPTEPKGVPCQ